ncbi:hypothetical protein P4O66_014611, partial [Electrophorus voltai]
FILFLSELSSDSHQAGSVGEDVISENIFRRFSEFGLSTWRDEFFVKVQDHPKGGTNGVTFYGTKFDESGYLAYSGNGSVEGAVLYCYYGQVSDFRNLQDLKVSPKGKIVLVRAGKISFAEKVHLGCGDPYTPGFPSFNHIQFPAVKSSGLPSIPAQTIRASTAAAIMGKMGGLDPPHGWGKGGLRNVTYKLGGENDVVQNGTGEYPFFGTMLDTRKNLDVKTSQNLLVLVKTAGEIAGQMALRLVHDHLLRLNVENYSNIIRAQVAQINKEVYSLQMSNRIPKTLEMQWLMSAMGSYSRASRRLTMLNQNSDLQDSEQCRIINDRIMGVEKDLLSPYVSPRESPFRHILLGSGSHTVGALLSHLAAIKEGSASADINLLKNQFALTTWTIQSCANALAGNVWEMDNQI